MHISCSDAGIGPFPSTVGLSRRGRPPFKLRRMPRQNGGRGSANDAHVHLQAASRPITLLGAGERSSQVGMRSESHDPMPSFLWAYLVTAVGASSAAGDRTDLLKASGIAPVHAPWEPPQLKWVYPCALLSFCRRHSHCTPAIPGLLTCIHKQQTGQISVLSREDGAPRSAWKAKHMSVLGTIPPGSLLSARFH